MPETTCRKFAVGIDYHLWSRSAAVVRRARCTTQVEPEVAMEGWRLYQKQRRLGGDGGLELLESKSSATPEKNQPRNEKLHPVHNLSGSRVLQG